MILLEAHILIFGVSNGEILAHSFFNVILINIISSIKSKESIVKPEKKEAIRSLVQGRIDGLHTTKARNYTSTTANGTDVQRIGMSVYLDTDKGDKQVEQISAILAELSVEGKAGHPDPIIVKASGIDWVVVSSQLSDMENNFSNQPKIILADLLIGSNAEVTEDERDNSVRLALEMRESSKNLKSQFPNQKQVVSTTSDREFEELLQ